MLKRCVLKFPPKPLVAAAVIGGCSLLFSGTVVPAYEILGTGTESLIGNDLTDLGDDGDPEANVGYDAIFDANDEPGFGGGEFAFNVFDNRLGPSNDKWCCGKGGGIFDDDPIWVSAQLPVPHFLTNFTVSSANDVPDRDPIYWSVQGSNDGVNYTDIYTYQDDFAPWDDRLQVIEFKEGDDFPVQTASYDHFRFATYNTVANPNGAYFQVGEIEYFGRADGAVPPVYIGGQGTIGQRLYEGDKSNQVFGPEMPGVSGWSVLLVDSDQTIDNHTFAEVVLDDLDGEVSTGSYPVVDLAGGAGTFTENLPYPNGIDNESMDDFAVRAEAEVVIPVGTWTIGFGTDDGGQITIPGAVFVDYLNSDSFEDDQIRFEGNRGHGWTVGSFEVTGQPLETTITASMHERGGGDTFEIAVIAEDVLEAANPNTGWELLGDNTLGWSVKHTGTPLLSADLSAEVSNTRVLEFDVNGDTDAADELVLENPDPNVYTTILDVDGVTFQIAGTGAFAQGDAFRIVDADKILGVPIITSLNPNQTWSFNAVTGQVIFGVGGLLTGDFNKNGVLDAGDIDDLTQQSAAGTNPAAYDLNADTLVDTADINIWIEDLNNSWIGDANLDGEFNTSDLVQVLAAGTYEQDVPADWTTGDFTGDGRADSSDLVAALSGGGYEAGTKAAVAAVPEPSSWVLIVMGTLAAFGSARRRK